MPPELAELRSWVEKADHDVRTAELAMEASPPITDTAAFHCQQAIEKLLKGYLFWQKLDFEKIHDLRALTLECGKYDSSFLAKIDRVGPLSSYAVRFRYPGPNDPTIDQVRAALSIAHEIRSFVLQRLPTDLLTL